MAAEEEYKTLAQARRALIYERQENDGLREDLRLLANALTDINNLIGEDEHVKRIYLSVARVVATNKV